MFDESLTDRCKRLEKSVSLESADEAFLIPLNRARFALVDKDNFAELACHRWWVTHNGYAMRKVTLEGKRCQIWMHREVMATPDGLITDHINGNRLDNRKLNLRICTTSENKRNGSSYKGAASPFKGVTLRRYDGYWCARIRVDKKLIHLGYFKNELDAAHAYNVAAIQLHGEFARLNDLTMAVVDAK